MRSSRVRIDSPCHESWEAMEGGAERRYCGVCEKHVHDLSAMNMADAEALLQASTGQHLCVRYTAEADGTLRFRDLVPRSRLTRKLLRTAFAAATLAACDAREVPAVDLGDAVIESIREDTRPTPDGGCDYSSGPFTTFHLPPGHVLCRQPGEEPLEDPLPRVHVPPPPPPMPMMGAPMPVEPPPAVDPVPRPKMGEMVAAPDPKAPFEPCDPKPVTAPPPERFAPPPPPPEREELMGDIAYVPPPEPRGQKTMGTVSRAGPDTMGKLQE
jgi:hypothetical protein